jgi:predicted metalloprotease
VRLQRADGTVIFGQRLLARLMRQTEAPDACVAAVCAHEFGHILQYKTGLAQVLRAGQPTVKRLELHADYMAGYFAGSRKRARQSYPAAVFAMTQFTFGDNMVNSPNHHGTADERAAAVVQGFESSFRRHLPIGEAIDYGVRYVQRI